VYAGHSISSAAYKWKININESGKQMAFYNVWPELNHNEMQGWFFPEEKGLTYVALTTPYEHVRIKKRIEVTHEVLREHGYDPIVVEARGDTPLEALLYLVMLGDYVTAFMGILNGIDPTSVDMIEDFKKKLGRP
jgi:glucose/mannose-6-phosphate isomerase